MDYDSARANLNSVLTTFDTILIGVAIPFAVATLVSEPSLTATLIGVAYFLTLLNFFHAKFNLTLVREFDEFSREAVPWVNFSNMTLHLVLIGSFVFMAFLLGDPPMFIVANLVMRFSDLLMDIVLLSTVGRLNLRAKTRRDLLHVHTSWLIGTLAFIIFFSISLTLLDSGRLAAVHFAAAFLALELVDVLSDYYINRRFYFGTPVRTSVRLVRNRKSREFVGASELVELLPERLRERCRTWMEGAVNTAGAGTNADLVVVVSEEAGVRGFAGLRRLVDVGVLAVEYLVIDSGVSWLRVARKLLAESVEEAVAAERSSGLSEEPLLGTVVEAEALESQATPAVRARLTVFLKQIGFRELGEGGRLLFLPVRGVRIDEARELERLVVQRLRREKKSDLA